MSDLNLLVVKQWGYQTICPDEEATTGLYQIEDYPYGSSIYGWKRPSFCSEKHEISHIIDSTCIWGWADKFNRRDGFDWVKVSKKPVYWIPKK